MKGGPRFILFIFLVAISFAKGIKADSDSIFALVQDLKHGDEVICKVNLGRAGFHQFPAYVSEISPSGMSSQEFIFWITTDDPTMNKVYGFGGMSGSPVYFKDKLIGAIGYGYSSLRKFNGGVTPAELFYPYFAQIPFDPPPLYRLKSGAFSPISSQSSFFFNQHQLGSPAASFDNIDVRSSGIFRQLFAFNSNFSTNVFPQDFKDTISFPSPNKKSLSTFMNFSSSVVRPTSRARATSSQEKIQENPFFDGAPCAIPFIVGDVFMNTSGTVTTVSGDKIVLFGHPFGNFGHIKMPLYTFKTADVLTSYGRSRWIGSVEQHVGTIYYDGKHGVLGRFEKNPVSIQDYMWPVDLSVSFAPEKIFQRFSFSIVKHFNFLLNALPSACVGVLEDIVELEKVVSQSDLCVLLNIRVFSSDSKQPPLQYKEVIPNNSPWYIAYAIENFFLQKYPLLFETDFFSVETGKIDIQVEYKKIDQIAIVIGATPDKPSYYPGDIATIFVKMRNFYGNIFTQQIQYKIPNHVVSNTIQVNIGSQSNFEKRRKIAQFGLLPNSFNSAQMLSELHLDSYQRVHHAVSDNFSYNGLSIWSEIQDDSSYSVGGYKYEFAPLFQKMDIRKSEKNDLKGRLVVRGKTFDQKFVVQGNIFPLTISIKKDKE